MFFKNATVEDNGLGPVEQRLSTVSPRPTRSTPSVPQNGFAFREKGTVNSTLWLAVALKGCI